jgi:hypothetical protein
MCCVYITTKSSIHKEMLYGNREHKKLQLYRGNALKASERAEGINKQMEVDNKLEDEPWGK